VQGQIWAQVGSNQVLQFIFVSGSQEYTGIIHIHSMLEKVHPEMRKSAHSTHTVLARMVYCD
jgi:hypothetical protein